MTDDRVRGGWNEGRKTIARKSKIADTESSHRHHQVSLLGATSLGSQTLMLEDFEHIAAALCKVSFLENSQIEEIAQYASRIELAKGGAILRPGRYATHVYIVISGILREFHTDLKGNEGTRSFSDEGTISGSLFDILSGKPAISTIEALEPTVLIALPWKELEKISENDLAWQRLRLRVTENLYIQKVLREHAMLTMSAAERLEKFRNEKPEQFSRIPKQALASYLGVTPIHLSRLLCANR